MGSPCADQASTANTTNSIALGYQATATANNQALIGGPAVTNVSFNGQLNGNGAGLTFSVPLT